MMTNMRKVNRMDELKPCPFCGGDRVKLMLEHDRDAGRCWYVGCEKCYARGASFSESHGDRQNGDIAYSQIVTTWKHATKAWNRREGEQDGNT